MLRRLLAPVIVALGLFAYAPHASADTLCTNLAVPPIITSSDICVPVP
jgi:hypothetical protein